MKYLITFFLFVNFHFSCKKEVVETSLKDIDGNEYELVTIGDQTWIASDFISKTYSNGDPIPNLRDCSSWSKTKNGAYCFYNNDSVFAKSHGALYNYYTILDPRGIAPTGYHVATLEDWEELLNYVGGLEVAGGKLKEAGYSSWNAPNSGATNEYNFNIKGGGYRDRSCAFFVFETEVGFWVDSKGASGKPTYIHFYGNSPRVTIDVANTGQEGSGEHIRLVKNK